MRSPACGQYGYGYDAKGSLCGLCDVSPECEASSPKTLIETGAVPEGRGVNDKKDCGGMYPSTAYTGWTYINPTVPKAQGINCLNFGINYKATSTNCLRCGDGPECKERSKERTQPVEQYKKPIENPKVQLLEDMLRDLHVYFVPDESEQITIEITRGNVRVKKTMQEDLAVTI